MTPLVKKIGKRVHAGGTFGVGGVETDYNNLVDKFGEPQTGSGDGKTQAEWGIQFVDGTIATIYDYKIGPQYLGPEEGIPMREVTAWNIGGKSTWAARLVNAVVIAKDVLEVKQLLIKGEFE